MTMIDHTTDRATLEIAAIFECNFDLQIVANASDDELRNMIIEWIESGDECAAA